MPKRGPFGIAPGEVITDVPDGVQQTYAGGQVRNSLYDATYVDAAYNGCGYGAFPGDDDSMAPWGMDEHASNGAVTGASSKTPLGRQR